MTLKDSMGMRPLPGMHRADLVPSELACVVGDGRRTFGPFTEADAFAAAVVSAVAPLLAEFDVAQLVDRLPAGPALAVALQTVDAALCTPEQQLESVLASERLASWAQASGNAAMVAYAGVEPRIRQITVDGRRVELEDERRSTIALACLWSEGAAHARLTMARALATDLPATREALTAGLLSLPHARVLSDAARTLTARLDALLDDIRDQEAVSEVRAMRRDLLTRFEARTVAHATREAVPATRARARRVITSLDPTGAAERRLRAISEQTDVTITHLPDGISMLTAVMASERAVACWQALTTLADDPHVANQQQPVGLRRADTLHHILTSSGSSSTTPGACTACGVIAEIVVPASGPRVRLNVSIDAADLLALRDHPAELEGVGPIPADVVRQMVGEASEASLRWLVTDTTGVVTDVSDTYRIGARLRALITARDGTCRIATCTRPARLCQPDHVTPFDAGGRSTPDNLIALCVRHHQLKTHAGWQLQHDPDGTLTITPPHGPARSSLPEGALTATTVESSEAAAEGQGVDAAGTSVSEASAAVPAMVQAGLHAAADLAHLHARLAEFEERLAGLPVVRRALSR